MTAHETKTFKNGNSVAVRLPKELGFAAGQAVKIEQRGGALVIRAVQDRDDARSRLAQLIGDLDAIGRPGVVQERAPIDFPDRPDLY